MAFMISKETENVQSSAEIENAFRAISAQVNVSKNNNNVINSFLGNIN